MSRITPTHGLETQYLKKTIQGDRYVKIKIEKHHIKQGKRRSPLLCPIGLALMEKLPKGSVQYVVVSYSRNDIVSVVRPEGWGDNDNNGSRLKTLFPTNSKLFNSFIDAFDKGDNLTDLIGTEMSFVWRD